MNLIFLSFIFLLNHEKIYAKNLNYEIIREKRSPQDQVTPATNPFMIPLQQMRNNLDMANKMIQENMKLLPLLNLPGIQDASKMLQIPRAKRNAYELKKKIIINKYVTIKKIKKGKPEAKNELDSNDVTESNIEPELHDESESNNNPEHNDANKLGSEPNSENLCIEEIKIEDEPNYMHDLNNEFKPNDNLCVVEPLETQDEEVTHIKTKRSADGNDDTNQDASQVKEGDQTVTPEANLPTDEQIKDTSGSEQNTKPEKPALDNQNNPLNDQNGSKPEIVNENSNANSQSNQNDSLRENLSKILPQLLTPEEANNLNQNRMLMPSDPMNPKGNGNKNVGGQNVSDPDNQRRLALQVNNIFNKANENSKSSSNGPLNPSYYDLSAEDDSSISLYDFQVFINNFSDEDITMMRSLFIEILYKIISGRSKIFNQQDPIQQKDEVANIIKFLKAIKIRMDHTFQ